MDGNLDSVNQIQNLSMLMREIGQDMIDVSDTMDEFLKLASDPIQIVFNKNLPEELKEIENSTNIKIMMIMNKMEVLMNYIDQDKKEGEDTIDE